jgi:hypothetical protein
MAPLKISLLGLDTVYPVRHIVYQCPHHTPENGNLYS